MGHTGYMAASPLSAPARVVFEVHVVDRLRESAGVGRRGPSGGLEDNDTAVEEIADLTRVANNFSPASERVYVDYLADKLAEVADQLRALKEFQDALIVFAHTAAVHKMSMRNIAARSGLSHTSVMRKADQRTAEIVGAAVQRVAEELVDGMSPDEDPALYWRLRRMADHIFDAR